MAKTPRSPLRARASPTAALSCGCGSGWFAASRARALSLLRLPLPERNVVQLAAQLLDPRLLVRRIFRLELDLVGRLLAEIGDRQPAPEHLVAADLQLGLVFRRQIVPDRLQVPDEVVERGVFADVDEVLNASRHWVAFSGKRGWRDDSATSFSRH